jgi:hypothetical protein
MGLDLEGFKVHFRDICQSNRKVNINMFLLSVTKMNLSIPNQFIDYILEETESHISVTTKLVLMLSKDSSIDSLIYLLSKMRVSDAVLECIIYKYSVEDETLGVDDIYNRTMIIKVTDYLKTNNKIDIRLLYEAINNGYPFFRPIVYDEHLATYDAISYITYCIISDNTQDLASVHVKVLELLIDVALKSGHNTTLVNILLEYLPDTSKYKSNVYRNSIITLPNIKHYITLLTENI